MDDKTTQTDLQGAKFFDLRNKCPKTFFRLHYMHNPAALDALTDLLEEIGVPMGSDTWPEQAYCRIQRMREAEGTLRRLEQAWDKEQEADRRVLWQKKGAQFADQSRARNRAREDGVAAPGVPVNS